MATASPNCLQVNQLLEVGDRKEGSGKYQSMDKWTAALRNIHAHVTNKVQA
jgi:hypothetical protein